MYSHSPIQNKTFSATQLLPRQQLHAYMGALLNQEILFKIKGLLKIHKILGLFYQ